MVSIAGSQDEEERIKEVDEMLAVDESKRKCNSLKEMQIMQLGFKIEAFQIKRKRPDHPMAQLLPISNEVIQ